MNNTRPIHFRRAIVALLSLQMALGPLASPAYAALTLLADEPIGFSPSAPPNLMLTVDDSTSMLSDFLPDYVIGSVPGAAPAVGGFCRDNTGLMSIACGNAGSPTTPPYVYSAGATLGGLAIPYPRYNASFSASTVPDWMRAWPAPVHNNALNRIYYDPSITYRPPVKYDGTSYPDQSAVVTTNWTKVVADPWALVPKYENLAAQVRVGMWCNSDWPTNVDFDPTAGGGVGGGDQCRINGTDYSGVAPAAPADYQYPWRKSSGADDVKYFQVGVGGVGSGTGNWNKVLWCDATSAKWPKNLGSCTTTYSCPVGQTYTPPPPLAQACFDGGVKNGCTGPVTYTPAGCNTNPAYGSPGPCVGAECLVCTQNACPTGPVGRTGRCRLTSNPTTGSNANCDCSPAGCSINPANAACTPYPQSGAGTCSGGAIPTPTTTCPNAAGGCGVNLYDPVLKTNTGPTMLADANGNGDVCRHNNQAYPDGTVALPFNYSAAHAKYKTAITSGCPAVNGFGQIPRHYWKTSVEWCSSKITTNNDKWRGFGLAGTCQDEHDLAHPYPRFYKWGVPKTDAAYLDNYTYGAFQRVDLPAPPSTVTYTHTYWKSGAFTTITRTHAEEWTNYANWFAYYRTRIQAAKTVISQNFSFLDDTYRIGFHTLSNNPTTSFVNVAPFDAPAGGQKDRWYTQLFGIQIRMGEQTPNINAVVRIGELFKNGSQPALIGSTDPIVLSCQKNYHMLFTDGITNQTALPAIVPGNLDNTVPALPQPIVVAPPIVTGAPWPPLYRENATAQSNTLSDYTTYYWVTDLRPAMTNNVLIGKDPAPWQHMNFAALSLGTEGTLPGVSPQTVEGEISAGTRTWPTVLPNTWQPNATGVDDLWHAAVNARGRFVNAKTSQQLGRGIAAILSDITSPAGSNSGASFANPNLTVTNNFTYVPRFVQGWGGNVQKIQIDPQTAAPQAVLWDAESALVTQTTPDIVNPSPWYTRRKIVTMNESGVAVPFLRANLGPTQLATLGPDSTTQDSVIEYLRGRRSNEGDDDGQYRVRTSPLGDIVDSQPQIVGAMSWDYWDYIEGNDPGYSAFRAAYSGRPGRIYVGANDGMLHAFDDTNGQEAWAFIPRDFYRSAPPVSNDKAGLVGLTYQPGGLPIYAHRFYVNATPRVVDADLGGALGWRTLLVSGLGKGGNSYFALDVTDPAAVVDENAAAAKVLWEFRNADLGYTYGRPMIVKTRAFGWTVIVTAGYNNPSGEGKLFFLRARDGQLLKTMTTSFGTPGSPSGLAHIAGYTKDYRNQLTEQIYGGDLYGNVWRFDVSDANDANWVVKKFAYLTDSGGQPQPITTQPRIDIDVTNGVDRWIFVGTGKLLHVDDLDDTQSQRMYAMRDGTHLTPTPQANPPLTVADLDLVSGVAGLGPGVVATKGWYDDLPPGQRIVKTPVTAVGLIGYISTGLPLDPCTVGQPVNIYVRQFGNGESRLQSGGSYVETIYEPTGGASVDVVATYDPTCTANCVPNIKIVVTSATNSQVLLFDAKLPDILGQHRLSWRTLSQ